MQGTDSRGSLHLFCHLFFRIPFTDFRFVAQAATQLLFLLICCLKSLFHRGLMYIKICVLLLVAVLSACSLTPREAPTEDVDKAAVLFFERLKAGEYEKIYNDSAKAFQAKTQKQSVIESLKQMAAMGTPGNPDRLQMTFNKEDGKRTADPTYAVRFDQVSASVHFRFMDEGGEWKLAAFELRQRGG